MQSGNHRRAREPRGGIPVFQAIAVISVVALVFVALGAVALGMSTFRTAKVSIPYTQTGSLTYSASVKPGSIYGSSSLSTGQPVMLADAQQLSLSFSYRLTSQAQIIGASGTSELTAVLDNGQGLTRTIVVQSPKPFQGTSATATGTLALPQLQALITSFEHQTQSNSLDLHIVPNFNVAGRMSAQPFKASFAPEVDFSVSGLQPGVGSTLTLTAASGVAPGGSSQAQLDKALAPSSSGKVAYRATVPATINLLVSHVQVRTARLVALIGVLACMAIGLFMAWPALDRRGKSADAQVARINARYGSAIVPVSAVALPAGPVIDVADVATLVDLARRYELAVLHHRTSTADVYLVLDGNVTYRHRLAGAAEEAPAWERVPTSTERTEPAYVVTAPGPLEPAWPLVNGVAGSH